MNPSLNVSVDSCVLFNWSFSKRFCTGTSVQRPPRLHRYCAATVQ
jgi:hypothetical protein